MPLVHHAPEAVVRPRVSVQPSATVELEWALSAAEHSAYRQDNAVLAALYEEHPGLLARVHALWQGEEASPSGGFLELMVVAHHGGLLFSEDASVLLERLEQLCATVPADPEGLALRSETDLDRQAILRRLARLRASAEIRHQYAQVLGDVWRAASPQWDRVGRPAVAAAVSGRRQLLARGATLEEVSRNDCTLVDELFSQVVPHLGGDDEVVVVPAFFTHQGLIAELPGLVVIGVRVDGAAAYARSRTEVLAHQLKAMSDPTRLAILDALASGPSTVTEVATRFGLAQPTVSNHVKILRQAGFLADQREGTRRNLVVRAETVDAVLNDLRDVLGLGLGSTGLSSTGLGSTGLGSTGLGSTGLSSTGLGSTGLSSTGLGSTGLSSTGLGSTGLGASASPRPVP